MTTAAIVNDSQMSFAVLVDRAEGASSLQDGALELLLHRRLLCQDGCAFENLNETDEAVYRDGELVERRGRGLIITGKHYLLMGAPSAVRTDVRLLQHQMYSQLHPVFAATQTAGDSAGQWRVQGRVGQLSFLKSSLPPNVELMTLQVLFDGSTLLRLSHSAAIGEAQDGFDEPASVDLGALFVQPIASVRQRTLTANADYKRGAKVRLPYETGKVSEEEWERVDRMHEGLQANLTVTIYPMQILTFQLSFS